MYFIFNYFNKAFLPTNMVLVLYVYNSVCHVQQEQRYISTVYDKAIVKTIMNLWQRKYIRIILQLHLCQ